MRIETNRTFHTIQSLLSIPDLHFEISTLSVILLLVLNQLSIAFGECRPPPEGIWNMDVYLPGNHFESKEGRAFGKLKQDKNIEQIYTGKFKGVSKKLRSRTLSKLFFVFDQETCSLYGSNIIPIPGVHDTLLLRWDGQSIMTAIAGVLLQGYAVSPARGLYVFKFIRPLNATTTDS